MITQEQVEEVKSRFRKMGIAKYLISGLDEDESIRSYLREKSTFRWAFVRDPYSRSKNLIWRLLEQDIWRPALPMGYYGCPGFTFDLMGTPDEALAEAIKIATIMLGRKYKARVMKDECWKRASFRQIAEERQDITEADRTYLKQRNYGSITWPNGGD